MSARYPNSRIDFQLIFKKKDTFSKIYLVQICYQIAVAEEDKPIIAIIISFGLFEFNIMSFGLLKSPFKCFIKEVSVPWS